MRKMGDAGTPICIGNGKRPDEEAARVPADKRLLGRRDQVGEQREEQREERKNQTPLRLADGDMPNAGQDHGKGQDHVGIERPLRASRNHAESF